MIKSASKYSIVALLFIATMSAPVQAQVSFTSDKYGYSFKHPESWYIKDKVYMANIDCKLVDGKGNSFITSVAPSTLSSEGLIREIEKISTTDLANGFKSPNYRSVSIITRERRTFSGRLCYYIKMNSILTSGETLISELYIYSSGKYEYSLNASYFESMKTSVEPLVRQMFSTFRF
jgi:hypothetical protein